MYLKDEPIRWTHVCKVALALGVMKNVSKAERLRIFALLNKSERVERLDRGLYHMGFTPEEQAANRYQINLDEVQPANVGGRCFSVHQEVHHN